MRLDLKSIFPGHATELFSLLNEQIMDIARLPSFQNESDLRNWIKEVRSCTHKHCYAVTHKDFGLLGITNLTVIKRSGYLFYWLGQRYWGQGLGTLAVKMTLTKVFTSDIVSCVFAAVEETNFRSIGLLKKLDFEHIRLEKTNPQFYFKGICKDPSCEIKTLLHAINSKIELILK